MGHSIRELKSLLQARGIDFSHCCERAELQQLLQENSCEEALNGSKQAQESQPHNVSSAAVPLAAAYGLSVRELKAALEQRRVDYSQCREKVELQELLHAVLFREQRQAKVEGPSSCSPNSLPAPVADSGEAPFPDGIFAARRSDGRLCWVEFITEGNALCHWDDGTDNIVLATDLEPLPEGALPGPPAFDGTFEEARAAAFHQGQLLVTTVHGAGTTGHDGMRKLEGLQALGLASDEVALLIGENAVFWRGSAQSLRAPHLQLLAPEGVPSLAMVLPLAVDAMRVLSHSPRVEKEAVVEAFVAALETLEAHHSMAEARSLSEAAILRQEQDEEFAASLVADQQAEESRRASMEVAAEIGAEVEAATGAAPKEGSSEAAVNDAAKRPAVGEDESGQRERLAKARRLLADEFLEETCLLPGAGVARLVLRLPTGERVQRSFGSEEPLSTVYRWAECCPLLPEASGRTLQIPEHFEFAMAFPQRTLGHDEATKTLAELGLVPSAALLLIDKDV